MKKLSLLAMAVALVVGGCDSSSRPTRSGRQGDRGREFKLWLKDSSGQSSANEGPISEHCFYVEVADTEQLRRRGLSGREYLSSNKGMLFVMPKASKMEMWMKDCLIALDVLFFDRDKRLINFHTMAVPLSEQTDAELPRYESDKPAKYALEVSAGIARQLGLKQGLTSLVFSDELLKRLQEGTE